MHPPSPVCRVDLPVQAVAGWMPQHSCWLPHRYVSRPVSMPPFASFLQEQTQRAEAAKRRDAAKAFAETIRKNNLKSDVEGRQSKKLKCCCASTRLVLPIRPMRNKFFFKHLSLRWQPSTSARFQIIFPCGFRERLRRSSPFRRLGALCLLLEKPCKQRHRDGTGYVPVR